MITVCGIGTSESANTHRVRVQESQLVRGVDIIATYGPGKEGACVIISMEDAVSIARYILAVSGEYDV